MPHISCITAPNPSPMTNKGTNTYLFGEGELAVIDPGPDNEIHLRTILKSLRQGEQITHILVTHSHVDHSELAARLSLETGARVYAYGNSLSGRSALMEELSKDNIGGGEGIDKPFSPDIRLKDSAQIEIGAFNLEAIYTPGHMSNHLCFYDRSNEILFTGDHLMGWSSTLVSPPDGDMTAFMQSMYKIEALKLKLCLPGHGEPIHTPSKIIHDQINHRKDREKQILTALSLGHKNAQTIATHIYSDIPEAMIPYATRNVLAHLIDLYQRNIISCDGKISAMTPFELNT